MLSTHMANQEDKLLAEHKVSSVAGHPNDKGTPREVFVHKFLAGHLSANVAIGQGEVINADSRPGEPRHQTDVVIYRREFPKLDLGGEVSGFLVESVVATIEVKSTLNQGAMDQAVSAAHQLKSLPRQDGGIRVTAGWVPPASLAPCSRIRRNTQPRFADILR